MSLEVVMLEACGNHGSGFRRSGYADTIEAEHPEKPDLRWVKSLPERFSDPDLNLSRDMQRISVRDCRWSPATAGFPDPGGFGFGIRRQETNAELNSDPFTFEARPVDVGDEAFKSSEHKSDTNSLAVDDQRVAISPHGATHCDDSSRDSGVSSLDGASPSRKSNLFHVSPVSRDITVKTLYFSDADDEDDLTSSVVMSREKIPRGDKKTKTKSPIITKDAHLSPRSSPAFSFASTPPASISKRTVDSHCVRRPLKRRVQVTWPGLVADRRRSGRVDVKSVLDGDVDDLIGDMSGPYRLPTVAGRHHDLKSISSPTLAQLPTDGRHVVDCRYPFEYDGGHIVDAVNVWDSNGLADAMRLVECRHGAGRCVYVFYCEFSSERAPNMCRLLRKLDREANADSYPDLCYPEMYLLEGGYKGFYEQYSRLCRPRSYQPMVDPEHVDEVKYCRTRSRSFAGGKASRVRSRRHLLQ